MFSYFQLDWRDSIRTREKDIEKNSVFACAGRADPQEAYGNDGIMPMFFKFNVMLEWYLPFYNGIKPNYLLYIDTIDENTHVFSTLKEDMRLEITAYPVEAENTTILTILMVPTDEARAIEIGAPLVQYCANMPVEIFGDTLPK